MILNAAEVMPNGQITLPIEIRIKMGLSTGDSVALIYDNNRVIMVKLTSGDGRMTFDEFLIFRDVKIKNSNHERIVRLFYAYLECVTGNRRLLPDVFGRLLNIDVSSITVPIGCFNGIFDGTEPPYEDVDFYIKFNNDIRVFVYGSIPSKPLIELRDNEYVLFILSDSLNDNIERKTNRYTYIT